MGLRGETGEETSQRGDQTAHDGRQSCGFPPAKRYRHRRQQQRHSRGHCTQPSCAHKHTDVNSRVQTPRYYYYYYWRRWDIYIFLNILLYHILL